MMKLGMKQRRFLDKVLKEQVGPFLLLIVKCERRERQIKEGNVRQKQTKQNNTNKNQI